VNEAVRQLWTATDRPGIESMKAKKQGRLLEWQGIISAKGGKPLGTLASISAKLATFFPGLSFEWSSTGAEQLAAIQGCGVELPDLVRRVVAAKQSNFSGAITNDQISVSFNLGTHDVVSCIWAMVAGEQKAVEECIARLKSQKGWVLAREPLTVQAVARGQQLKLTGGATFFHELPDSPP